MSAVAAPDARHHHDDQHGVELEDEQSPRVPESATEALPEAKKIRQYYLCKDLDIIPRRRRLEGTPDQPRPPTKRRPRRP